MIFKLGVFFVAIGLVKLLVALIARAKEREVKNEFRREVKKGTKNGRSDAKGTCRTAGRLPEGHQQMGDWRESAERNSSSRDMQNIKGISR